MHLKPHRMIEIKKNKTLFKLTSRRHRLVGTFQGYQSAKPSAHDLATHPSVIHNGWISVLETKNLKESNISPVGLRCRRGFCWTRVSITVYHLRLFNMIFFWHFSRKLWKDWEAGVLFTFPSIGHWMCPWNRLGGWRAYGQARQCARISWLTTRY